MDISILNEYITLMTYGTGARAARKLNLDPSTLSRHMSALEAELGVQLLKHGKKTEFTPAALALAPAIVDVVHSYEALLERIPQVSSESAPLKVFCPSYDLLATDILLMALERLSPAESRLVTQVPRIESDDLYEALRDGEVDAVLGLPISMGQDAAIDVREILYEDLVVCMDKNSPKAERLGDVESIRLEDLAGMVLPVTTDASQRTGFENIVETLTSLGAGIGTVPVIAKTTREYYAEITGNRFCCLFSGIESRSIPFAQLGRMRMFWVNDERISSARVLTTRHGEGGRGLDALVGALGSAVEEWQALS